MGEIEFFEYRDDETILTKFFLDQDLAHIASDFIFGKRESLQITVSKVKKHPKDKNNLKLARKLVREKTAVKITFAKIIDVRKNTEDVTIHLLSEDDDWYSLVCGNTSNRVRIYGLSY